MSSTDGTDYLNRAKGKKPASILLMVIGAPLLALGSGVAETIDAILGIYSAAASALSKGINKFILAFTADPAGAMSDVIAYAADSIQEGPWAILGPVSMPIFAFLLLLTIWEFLKLLDQRDSDIPFTGANVPFLLGNDGDDEEE